MSEFTRFLNGLNLIAKYDQSPDLETDVFLISISDHIGRIWGEMTEHDRTQMTLWGWTYQRHQEELYNFWEFQLGDDN